MDAHRFDGIVQALPTRRSLLGFAAAFAAMLGLGEHDAAEARCKKTCGPCRRCKKGKCKPKPGDIPCGPCSRCQAGQCKALCNPDDCVDDGEEDVCRRVCDPPCDVCSFCNQILGQCEVNCAAAFCTPSGCRVPCDPPCGECSVCDFGECVALCDSQQCVNDRCELPCQPPCGDDEECLAGACYPVCDPPCEGGQGCIAGGECVDFAGGCPAGPHACFTGEPVSCLGSFRCVTTSDGSPFCAQGVTCDACETDVDCQNLGYGPNSRCIVECEFCPDGPGCVTFAGG